MPRWLRCYVSKGMFSHERIIVVRRKGNGSVEFFVPKDSVRGEGDDGAVKVEVEDYQNSKWAILPTPYKDSIPINDEELVPA